MTEMAQSPGLSPSLGPTATIAVRAASATTAVCEVSAWLPAQCWLSRKVRRANTSGARPIGWFRRSRTDSTGIRSLICRCGP